MTFSAFHMNHLMTRFDSNELIFEQLKYLFESSLLLLMVL